MFKNDNPQNRKILKIITIVFFVLLTLNVVAILNKPKLQVSSVDYSQFLKDVADDKIISVNIIEKNSGPREIKVVPKEGNNYLFRAPHDAQLIKTLVEKNVKITTEEEAGPSFLSAFFFSWGPTIFLIVAWIYIMKKMSGGGGSGLFSINKSKAQLIDPDKIDVSFKDVVGCDEAKEEVQEFVEFLKNPEKFSKLGGKTPRGVLLTGSAGTGKTMLAKALAKESGVPFYSMSGSDFVEMFVGVGASRVRDMFDTAKKAAPCVLFIDEIDAIGGKRGTAHFGGGHDEREQTLNQILVELDGMDTNKGVILVCATNRPEILDPALLRPGRIDRQIVVSLPDVKGREEMLKIHSNNVPLDNNCNLKKIARGTPGFSGAELANLINEAAIYAARRNSKFVEQIDLEKAKDKIMMGVERPSLSMTEEDKKDTAYHEAGHAIVAKSLKNSDPVYKVTIIPRGRALGVTMQLPEKDRHSHKKEYLIDRIAILMGGRAAEEIFCNTMTNGASNDISVATSTARAMIMEWGMGTLGPVAFGQRSSSYLGAGAIDVSGLSQDTLRQIDLEVQSMLQEQYEKAKTILIEQKSKVEAMTQALLDIETLDDWHIDNIMKDRPYNDVSGFIEHQEIAKNQDLLDKQNEPQEESENATNPTQMVLFP